jgi:hypothetical protein
MRKNKPGSSANDFAVRQILDNPITQGANSPITLAPSFYFHHITPIFLETIVRETTTKD